MKKHVDSIKGSAALRKSHSAKQIPSPAGIAFDGKVDRASAAPRDKTSSRLRVFVVMHNTDLGRPPVAVFDRSDKAAEFVRVGGEESPGLPKYIVWPEEGILLQ